MHDRSGACGGATRGEGLVEAELPVGEGTLTPSPSPRVVCRLETWVTGVRGHA